MGKTPEEIIKGLIAPGAIFKRILRVLQDNLDHLHLDGPPEYQRGYAEGYRAAMESVKTVDGNLACEVTALRHRTMKKVITG